MSISHTTSVAYNSGFKHFQRFLAMYNFTDYQNNMPFINEDILLYYVAHCQAGLKLKYATIKLYLAGVRRAYVAVGLRNPLVDVHNQPLIRLQGVLRGVKRVQGKSTPVREPVTGDILRTMCIALQRGVFGPYVDLMLETACSIAFFGFLRCGEFTAANHTFDPAVNLCLRDISAAPHGKAYILHLKTSKTDPFRQGVDIFLHSTGQVACPWRSISAFLRVRRSRGGTAHDPLFLTPEGRVMTRAWFLDKLQTLFTRIGMRHKFTGHSFRSGAATTAAKVNISDHLIKTLGRWTSDCYCRYVNTPQSLIREAQQKMCYA